MNPDDLSLRLNVQEFFTLSNWEGRKRQLSKPVESQSWQRQTVQHFFTHSNWHGATISQEGQSITTHSSPLTLTVEQFCQAISWKGKPKVAVNNTPKSSTHTNLDSQPPSLTVNNLFDLL